MQTDNGNLLRLKVVAEASLDPLIHILQYLQAAHVLPVRINASRASIRGISKEVLEIEIDTAAAELTPEAFRLLTARINQIPMVFTTAS